MVVEREHPVGYFLSRRVYSGLAVAVKRFPSRAVGPDFVLVHGIGVSSRYFHPTALELAAFGTVWLVDLPGHGDAPDPKKDVTIADHASALNDFVREVGRPVLVGHSMGAQVVSQLAATSQAAEHVVLMAPTMPPQYRSRATAIALLAKDMTREHPSVFGITSTDVLFKAGIPFALRQLKHLIADRIEDRLPHMAAKTLVLLGAHDPIVPLEWAQECADLAHAPLKVVEGAHVIMHSAPVEVARLISEHAA